MLLSSEVTASFRLATVLAGEVKSILLFLPPKSFRGIYLCLLICMFDSTKVYISVVFPYLIC